MPAPEGNKFWTARSKHGRNPIFEDPQRLWEACEQYFLWVDENPLQEEKLVSFQGESKREPVAKMRAMTLTGLCNFLDIGISTWWDYRKRQGFSEITGRVEQFIYQQKFEGAAANLLNPNIIARELGLADKQEHTGPDGGPIQTTALSDFEIARRLAFILEKGLRDKQATGGQITDHTGNAQKGAHQ